MNERQFQRETGELAIALGFALAAGIGGFLRSSLVALFGALGMLSALTLYLWQRTCLARVSYRRSVSATRAEFGEELTLEVELVNDKLLPLPWVRVVDQVPRRLSVAGLGPAGPYVPPPVFDPSAPDALAWLSRESPETRSLLQEFAMLPFQRTMRRIAVSCDRRGRHHFGVSVVTSGDPLGVRERELVVEDPAELIVYPKLLSISTPPLASRTPIGDDRAARLLVRDPTRVAGMRSYRAGDPLRHIDWRATARSGDLLVRDFEPTTTRRVTLFVDLGVEGIPGGDDAASPEEFAISLAASFVAWCAELDYPVGLFAPGTAEGQPVGHDPSATPVAIATMLELLAVVVADPARSLGDVLALECERLRRGTTAVVIAADFPAETLTAIAECRRRAPVTAVFIATGKGSPPPPGAVDAGYTVAYEPDWLGQDRVVLTG